MSTGLLPQVAVLLDAQHPDQPPPILPGAQVISHKPAIINEPVNQLSGTTNITAR